MPFKPVQTSTPRERAVTVSDRRVRPPLSSPTIKRTGPVPSGSKPPNVQNVFAIPSSPSTSQHGVVPQFKASSTLFDIDGKIMLL